MRNEFSKFEQYHRHLFNFNSITVKREFESLLRLPFIEKKTSDMPVEFCKSRHTNEFKVESVGLVKVKLKRISFVFHYSRWL